MIWESNQDMWPKYICTVFIEFWGKETIDLKSYNPLNNGHNLLEMLIFGAKQQQMYIDIKI